MDFFHYFSFKFGTSTFGQTTRIMTNFSTGATAPTRFVCVALIAFAALAVIAGANTLVAAVPSSIAIQGRLTDSTGSPLPAGAKNFVFRIYDAESLGTEIWPGGAGETQSLNSDLNGLWVGLVGAVIPLNAGVFSDTSRWLAVVVDGTALPRVRLSTNPFAYRVATIDGASGGTISGNVGIFSDNPTSVLTVNGSFATRVRYTATSTTLDHNDHYVIATANFITLTLPPAATCPGRHYFVKDLVAGDSQVTVAVADGSGDAIDGSPTLVLTVQYMSYSLVSDGVSRWLIID